MLILIIIFKPQVLYQNTQPVLAFYSLEIPFRASWFSTRPRTYRFKDLYQEIIIKNPKTVGS